MPTSPDICQMPPRLPMPFSIATISECHRLDLTISLAHYSIFCAQCRYVVFFTPPMPECFIAGIATTNSVAVHRLPLMLNFGGVISCLAPMSSSRAATTTWLTRFVGHHCSISVPDTPSSSSRGYQTRRHHMNTATRRRKRWIRGCLLWSRLYTPVLHRFSSLLRRHCNRARRPAWRHQNGLACRLGHNRRPCQCRRHHTPDSRQPNANAWEQIVRPVYTIHRPALQFWSRHFYRRNGQSSATRPDYQSNNCLVSPPVPLNWGVSGAVPSHPPDAGMPSVAHHRIPSLPMSHHLGSLYLRRLPTIWPPRMDAAWRPVKGACRAIWMYRLQNDLLGQSPVIVIGLFGPTWFTLRRVVRRGASPRSQGRSPARRVVERLLPLALTVCRSSYLP